MTKLKLLSLTAFLMFTSSSCKDNDSDDKEIFLPSTASIDVDTLTYPSEIRFDGLSVFDYQQQHVPLTSQLKPGTYKFIQLLPGVCDPDCVSNRAEFEKLKAISGDQFSFVTLTKQISTSADTFQTTDAKIYQTFETLFNWNKNPQQTLDGNLIMPPLTQPEILILNKENRLIWSWEGKLETDFLTSLFNTDPQRYDEGLPTLPGWKSFWPGEASFDDRLRKTKYTAILSVTPECGSVCVDLIKAWSQTHSLGAYCANAAQGRCQVLIHYAGAPDAANPEPMLSAARAYLQDPSFEIFLDTKENPMLRFHTYLKACFPRWGKDATAGAIIYDREGKIVKDFTPGEFTNIYTTMRALP